MKTTMVNLQNTDHEVIPMGEGCLARYEGLLLEISLLDCHW